jgi:hypothetical protein
LKEAFKAEACIKYLKSAIEYGIMSDTALIKLEYSVPCILHLENRVSEKVIRSLLIKGLNDRAHKSEQRTYLAAIEAIVNHCILGHDDQEAQ